MKTLGFATKNGNFEIPVETYHEDTIGILGGINYAGQYYVLAVDVNGKTYAYSSTRVNIVTLFENSDR